MSNKDLNVSSGIDIQVNSTNVNKSAFIPAGAIIMIGGSSYSSYSDIDALGMCPCDGRALNTYQYRGLHKAISDTWGGTAYEDGRTNVPSATTTFNVPNLNTNNLNNNPIFIKGASGNVIAQYNSGTHFHSDGLASPTTTRSKFSTSSFDHNHSGNVYIYAANMGSHGHNIDARAANSGWADLGASGKSDGTATAAGNGHTHDSMYFAGVYVASDPSSHDHYGSHYLGGDGGGTSHSHNVSTIAGGGTTNTRSQSIIPYVVSLFFIRL